MTPRALAAIVGARLRAERRIVVYTCAAAAVAGVIQPRGLAGPLFFCSMLGIVVALAQTPGRFAHLDLCEQSAPLFGRELARAKALVACIIALPATLFYCIAAVAGGFSGVLPNLGLASAAVVAVTLVTLSATIRTGLPRLLYIFFACAASGAAYVLATRTGSYLAEPALCATVSFFALRQYGEALARYDPIGMPS